MTRYSDDDLETMLLDLESDLSERKEPFKGDAPAGVRQAVCAFANDLPDHRRAGVVFVGARNDGTPTRLEITDELLLSLADIKTDGNILPPPTITVSKKHLCGGEIAVITVEPSDSPPVRYKGRICIRIGPRRGIASAQDERILNERRRFRDIPFDAQPVPSATLTDINRRVFLEEYIPSAIAPDVQAANQRSYEQQLAASKMISSVEAPVPTVVGLLVLGIRARDYLPGAYVQFLRIDGTDLTDDIVDELAIEGPVSQIIRQLDEKMISHNRVSLNFVTVPKEQRVETYPIAALQQITRNAVMHRSYEGTNTPVRVYWYNDRIEVISPGGPYGSVNAANFGDPGVTDYRNPNLAEAMRVLGYVQRFGAGIQVARSVLEKNGNPPLEFDVTPSMILCRILSRRVA